MECSVCRLCSTCCARDAKCNPNIAPATQFSTPQNPFGNPLSVPFPTTSTTSVTAPKDCFLVRDHPNFSPTVYPPESLLQVPNMFKEHRSTVSGAYFPSQSLWRNGFPVYIQAPMPTQKEPCIARLRPASLSCCLLIAVCFRVRFVLALLAARCSGVITASDAQ